MFAQYYSQFKLSFIRVGVFVYVCVVFSTALDQWITSKMHDQLLSQEGIGPGLWLLGGLSLLNSLIFPLLSTTLIVISLQEKENFIATSLRNLNQVLIECLRSWGKALSWSFLFIIPGIIKWIQFSFVPYVVLLAKPYQQGQIDALEFSKKLSSGKRWRIFFLLLLFAVILPLLMTSFDEFKILTRTPVSSLLLMFMDTMFLYLFTLTMLRFFNSQNIKTVI